MHAFYALVSDKKDRDYVINYLYDLCNRGEFDYFDEDTLKVFSGKEAKEMADIYCLMYMSNGMTTYYEGNHKEFNDTLNNVNDNAYVWKVDVHI